MEKEAIWSSKRWFEGLGFYRKKELKELFIRVRSCLNSGAVSGMWGTIRGGP